MSLPFISFLFYYVPSRYFLQRNHQVNADINNGKISSTQGQALIDEANTVINAIDSHATKVPEFPSIALPVAAILGLVLIFGRKKE